MAPITSLAPELLQRILEFSEPPEHLHLALTCKTLHGRLDYILRHSQECHGKYRAVSDTNPSTIPNLVRAILIKQDWVAAWHIRAIEIWGCRANFDDWQPYRLISPGDRHAAREEEDDNDDDTNRELYQEGYFTEQELVIFKKALVEILKIPEEFMDDEGDLCSVDGLVEDISEGGVRFLAVLLMALVPRLQTIRFIRGNPAVEWTPTVLALAQCIKFGSFPAPVRIVPKTWEERREENEKRQEETGKSEDNAEFQENYDKEWNAYREGVDVPEEIKRQWPAGFLSVKEIVVGVSCRAFPALDGGPEEEEGVPSRDRTDMTQIAPLMRLPCLESLWVHGFSDETEEAVNGPHGRWDLPTGCSTIRTLVFDSFNRPEHQPVGALIESCGKLEHLTFLGGDIGDNIECDLILGMCRIPREGQILKSVLWCGGRVRGYRSSMFYPEENNENYPTLTVSVDDLILMGVEGHGRGDGSGNSNELKGFVTYLWELLENLSVQARVLTKKITFTCQEEFFEQALIGAVRTVCWDECWDRNMNEDYDEEGNLKKDADSRDENEEDEAEDSEGAEKEDETEVEKDEKEAEEPLPCGCLPSWENHYQYPFFPKRVPALYLEDLDRWFALSSPYPGEVSQPPDAPIRDPTKRPLGELIRLCKLWGVEIHTRTTPVPRVHNTPMPTVASEKDIETSPWYKHPDVERLYFKPHKGMVDDDCGNCGECEECYKLHPAECWVKWKEDDAHADEERREREAEEGSDEVDEDEDGEEEDGEE